MGNAGSGSPLGSSTSTSTAKRGRKSSHSPCVSGASGTATTRREARQVIAIGQLRKTALYGALNYFFHRMAICVWLSVTDVTRSPCGESQSAFEEKRACNGG